MWILTCAAVLPVLHTEGKYEIHEEQHRQRGSHTNGGRKSRVGELVVHRPQGSAEPKRQEQDAEVGEVHDIVSKIVGIQRSPGLRELDKQLPQGAQLLDLDFDPFSKAVEPVRLPVCAKEQQEFDPAVLGFLFVGLVSLVVKFSLSLSGSCVAEVVPNALLAVNDVKQIDLKSFQSRLQLVRIEQIFVNSSPPVSRSAGVRMNLDVHPIVEITACTVDGLHVLLPLSRYLTESNLHETHLEVVGIPVRWDPLPRFVLVKGMISWIPVFEVSVQEGAVDVTLLHDEVFWGDEKRCPRLTLRPWISSRPWSFLTIRKFRKHADGQTFLLET